MTINQHHIRFLRKKHNELQGKKMEPHTIWSQYWLHSASALLGVEVSTSSIFELANNLFEPCENNAKNIGNIYAALTALNSKVSDRNISDLNEYDGIKFKKELGNLLTELKNEDDTFRMYEYGEIDTRSIYCSIIVASLIDFEISVPIDYLLSCQSYDGGFSGVPDTESHAGFTYCAIASLAIGNGLDKCNMIQLVGWLACRAENVNGRTSKESDSCYAFWIGATTKILQTNGYINAELSQSFFDSLYVNVMSCEQKWGGFNNRQGGKPDLQHTAYALFFLSLNDKFNNFSYTIDPLFGNVKRKQ